MLARDLTSDRIASGTSMFRQTNNSAAFARQLPNFEPDANQTEAQYVMVNCHRQWGKTTMTAMRAVHRAVTKPGQQIVVVSASLRQSMALANKCREFASQLHLTLRVEAANKGSILFDAKLNEADEDWPQCPFRGGAALLLTF